MDYWNGFFELCTVICLLAISVGCFEKGQGQASKNPTESHYQLKRVKRENERGHNRINLLLLRLLTIKDKLVTPGPVDSNYETKQRIQLPIGLSRRIKTVEDFNNNETAKVYNNSKTISISPKNEYKNMDLLNKIINVVNKNIVNNNETKKTFHKKGNQRTRSNNEISIFQGKTRTVDSHNKNEKTFIQKETSMLFAHNKTSNVYSQSEISSVSYQNERNKTIFKNESNKLFTQSEENNTLLKSEKNNTLSKSESKIITQSESKIFLQSKGDISQTERKYIISQDKSRKFFTKNKSKIFLKKERNTLQSKTNNFISQSERNNIFTQNKTSKILSQKKSRNSSKSKIKIFLQSKISKILTPIEGRENIQSESRKIFSNDETSNLVHQRKNNKIFSQTESNKIFTNSETSKILTENENRNISQNETSKIFSYNESNKIVNQSEISKILGNKTKEIFRQSESKNFKSENRKFFKSESSKIFTHNKSRIIVQQNENNQISIQNKIIKIFSGSKGREILSPSEGKTGYQNTKINNETSTTINRTENSKGTRTIFTKNENSTTSTRNKTKHIFQRESKISQYGTRPMPLNNKTNQNMRYEYRTTATFNGPNKDTYKGSRHVIPNSDTKNVFSQREGSKILTHRDAGNNIFKNETGNVFNNEVGNMSNNEASNIIAYHEVRKTVSFNENDNIFFHNRTSKIISQNQTRKIFNKISYHKKVQRIILENGSRKSGSSKTVNAETERIQDHNKTGNVDPNVVTNRVLSYEKSQISPQNETGNGTVLRKRRYNYEDTYEWEEDEKLLEYDVDEDSLVQKIGRHWKKVAASLCFVCAGVILACIIGRLACTICWPQIKAACFLTYCPLLDFIKSQYDILCRDDSDKLERDFRTVANMLGIKLTIEDFKAIKEHYGFDKGKNFQDPNTLRGAAKKWEVDVGVPII